MSDRGVLLFTKPATPGQVKTRLIGELSAEQAAALHAAFLGDLCERLGGGRFELQVAWALREGEEPPLGLLPHALPGVRQRGDDLGARLFTALAEAGSRHRLVAAIGSDHPELHRHTVEEAFDRLEQGAEVVFGPAEDGGYYLVAVRSGSLSRRLFEEIPWSTSRVLAKSLERAAELGLRSELLASAYDVDTEDDLQRLTQRLAAGELGCPRTRSLLCDWGRLG